MSYRTSEIATIIGIHPNTVRLYEELGFITPPVRQKNGYRVYEELHIRQLRFARALLRGEVLQRGLRHKALDTIRLFAAREFVAAETSLLEYDAMLQYEIESAKSAASAANAVLRGEAEQTACNAAQTACEAAQTACEAAPAIAVPVHEAKVCETRACNVLRRTDAAELLCVTVDALRTWEMNGLIDVKRLVNGYRVYSPADIQRLRLIKTLRLAGYSQTAILRLLSNPAGDARITLNTPDPGEEIISVCDRLIVSLESTRGDVAEAKKELTLHLNTNL